MIRMLLVLLALVLLPSCWSDKAVQMHVNAATAVVAATNGTRLMLEEMHARDVSMCGSDTDCAYRFGVLYHPAIVAVYYFELALDQWKNGVVLYQMSKEKIDFAVVARYAGMVVVAFDSMVQTVKLIGVNLPPVPGLGLLCLVVDPDTAKRSALCGKGYDPPA